MPLGRIIGNGHGAATTPHCGEGLRWGMTRAMLKDFPGSASNVMKVLKLGYTTAAAPGVVLSPAQVIER